VSKKDTAAKKHSLATLNLAMLVRRFGAKARCIHSYRSASKLWMQIVDSRLTSKNVMRLSVAWAHARGDEGPAELDGIVKELTAAYPAKILRR
jgi:hypothetical protein